MEQGQIDTEKTILIPPMFEQYLTVQDEHRRYEKLYHTMRTQFLVALGERLTYKTEGYLLSVFIQERHRFDNKRFMVEHPDLYEDYSVLSIAKQIQITKG